MLTIGIAITADNIWIAMMIVPAIVIIQIFVIHKEEKYLEKKFGEEYLQYKKTARRWL